MDGINEVKSITAVRDGVWFISYVHECGCGCTKKRFNFTHIQKAKPTDNKAKQLADAHYSQQ